MRVCTDVPLARHTTLEVGGPARYWLEAADENEVVRGLDWAHEHGLRVEPLGCGSNVVVADRGLDALVLRPRMRHRVLERAGDALELDVGAGHPWDEFVTWMVDMGASGVECLAGIPGDVGAAPIQNIGAYGQEVASSIVSVQVVERTTGRTRELAAASCGFAYRDSIFKREPERFIVTAVRLRLHQGEPAAVNYAELSAALGGSPLTVASVRQTVLSLRRRKSMVLDPADPNSRSAGSFFTNPVVSQAQALEVATRAAPTLAAGETMPQFATREGTVKLAAAWLIERAGLPKGVTRGRVGLSSRHSLALVNRGDATAAEILAFATEIRNRVRDRFDISLAPEVRFLGFTDEEMRPLLA